MAQLHELVMACFVEIVDQAADAKGFNKGRFAQAVWPNSTLKHNRNRWLNMRTSTHQTGQPQGVLISDAYKMTEVLDEDFAMLIHRSKELALSRLKKIKTKDKEKASSIIKKK